jgi:hypothetical protein
MRRPQRLATMASAIRVKPRFQKRIDGAQRRDPHRPRHKAASARRRRSAPDSARASCPRPPDGAPDRVTSLGGRRLRDTVAAGAGAVLVAGFVFAPALSGPLLIVALSAAMLWGLTAASPSPA